MDQRFKIGMRTVKTAVAVLLCMLVMAPLPVDNSFYACIAAVICMQPTLEHTIHAGLNRMKGTIVGAILGIAAMMIEEWTRTRLGIALAPVGVILILYLCNVLKIQASCSIGCVVYLSLLLVQRDIPPYLFGLMRAVETVVGILIAMFVNYCLDRSFLEKIRRLRK